MERPVRNVGDEIVRLAAQLAATTCRWLELIADFDRRGGWHDAGQRSCAEWVAWRCAVTPAVAREHVRVARSLARLPRTTALFARGELSYSKVRAISRLQDVEHEEEVLRLATHATAGELERLVSGFRRVVALEGDARDARGRRYLSLRPREDGTVAISGRVSAEEGAVLAAALDSFRAQLWAEAPPAPDGHAEFSVPEPDDGELWRTAERKRAATVDALVRLADAALTAGVAAGRSAPERHQVVVHVDAGALSAEQPAPGRLQDGTAIAPSVVRRLCCDASTTAVLEAGGTAIDVGRRTRTIPPGMRRALTARDRGCRFPGCQATRHLDAHHVKHWVDGGATATDNLVLLCRRHHAALHEGGFTLHADTSGALTFRHPDGRELARRLPDGPHPARRRPPTRRLAPRGLRRGDGVAFDRGRAVEALLRAAGPRPPSEAEA